MDKNTHIFLAHDRQVNLLLGTNPVPHLCSMSVVLCGTRETLTIVAFLAACTTLVVLFNNRGRRRGLTSLSIVNLKSRATRLKRCGNEGRRAQQSMGLNKSNNFMPKLLASHPSGFSLEVQKCVDFLVVSIVDDRVKYCSGHDKGWPMATKGSLAIYGRCFSFLPVMEGIC